LKKNQGLAICPVGREFYQCKGIHLIKLDARMSVDNNAQHSGISAERKPYMSVVFNKQHESLRLTYYNTEFALLGWIKTSKHYLLI
jgi:arginine/lysine/ornithine decarboxylase